eukprot:jgi/Tetstr1/437855/TSEL_026495.t1
MAASWRWEGVPACGGLSPELSRAGACAVLAGRHLYLLGGRDRNSYLSDMLRFDMDSRQWDRPPARVPFGSRAYFTATLVQEQIWVVGGSSVDHVVRDVHVFDLGTQRWFKPVISGDTELLVRAAHTAVEHPTKPGHLLLFGGTTEDSSTYRSDVAELHCNLEHASVRLVAPPAGNITEARAYHTMTSIGHRCFVVGGKLSQKGRSVRQCSAGSMVAVYDCRKGKWESGSFSTGDVPAPRSSHAAAALGDQVVVFGGTLAVDEGNRVERIADMYSFTYVLGTIEWQRWPRDGAAPGGARPCGRAAHSMVAADSALLLMCGYSGDGVFTGDIWMCHRGEEDALRHRVAAASPPVRASPAGPAAAGRERTPPRGHNGWQRKRSRREDGSPLPPPQLARRQPPALELRPTKDLGEQFDRVEDADEAGPSSNGHATACGNCAKRLKEVKHLQEQLKLRVEEENAIRADRANLSGQIHQLEEKLRQADHSLQQAHRLTALQREQDAERAAQREAEVVRLEALAKQATASADAAKAECVAAVERAGELEADLNTAHSILDELRTEKARLQSEVMDLTKQREADREALRRERVAVQELHCEQERLARRVQEQNHAAAEAQHALKETARKARESNQARQRAEERESELQAQLRQREERLKRVEMEKQQEREAKARELDNMRISRDAAEERAKLRDSELSQLRGESERQRLKLSSQGTIIQHFRGQLDSITACASAAQDRMQMLMRNAEMP